MAYTKKKRLLLAILSVVLLANLPIGIHAKFIAEPISTWSAIFILFFPFYPIGALALLAAIRGRTVEIREMPGSIAG